MTPGALLALEEHSLYTQGRSATSTPSIKWGVELGKVVPKRIIPELESKDEPALGHDSSTNALIRRYRQNRARR